MEEKIFGLVLSAIVFGGCAIFMLGIGIAQIKSKKPVGFYSGEKPPREDELTDVEAWNKKHGKMWIIYGGILIASWVFGYFCGDSAWILLPYCGGLLIPVVFMIRYHKKLIKQYKIQ